MLLLLLLLFALGLLFGNDGEESCGEVMTSFSSGDGNIRADTTTAADDDDEEASCLDLSDFVTVSQGIAACCGDDFVVLLMGTSFCFVLLVTMGDLTTFLPLDGMVFRLYCVISLVYHIYALQITDYVISRQ